MLTLLPWLYDAVPVPTPSPPYPHHISTPSPPNQLSLPHSSHCLFVVCSRLLSSVQSLLHQTSRCSSFKECWRLPGCHEVYPSRQRRRLKTVDTQVANSWMKSFLFLRDWMWCRQIVRKISAVWGKIDLLFPSPLPTLPPHPHPLIYVYNLLSRWRHFAVWLAGRKARDGHEKHNITGLPKQTDGRNLMNCW